MKRPPTSDWLVFIHAGGLHGVPITFRPRLKRTAWRSSGRISRSSWAIENRRIPKSVDPAGRSS